MWSCVHEGVNHELLSSSPGFLGEIDFLEFKEGARWCCTRPIPFTMRHITLVPLGPSEPTPRPSQGYGQKAPCRGTPTLNPAGAWGLMVFRASIPCLCFFVFLALGDSNSNSLKRHSRPHAPSSNHQQKAVLPLYWALGSNMEAVDPKAKSKAEAGAFAIF